ncbi:DUF29 domain-containing protein [Candidatus Synechococcus calcipolaris G9]|uniref:DUF29 domain-containing protein n=1 Tax=Candidatus Synechococcus calcipolaris G9 TaxID=1497997 RepID=A0ABT6EZA0_9SYNE|nr:DUF29 family protein [Candidatus Synechococcus calcipolaris]MDG2990941.1 DUF29 domain-containing protein [Candidatus Synechococcus calcipolaris G9]
MNSEVTTEMVSLYDIDFQCWLGETVAQLRGHDFNNLDLENLIEEIEGLGKAEGNRIPFWLDLPRT